MTDTQKTTAVPANDDVKVTSTVTLTDLCAALGLDEDAMIERIGDALLKREEPNHGR